MAAALERVHATAIACNGRAALIRGSSGSGKSDLALRCLAASVPALHIPHAQLIADDQVLLSTQSGVLRASAPPSIANKLEIRGLGILTISSVNDVPVYLVADLTTPDAVERLPETSDAVTLLGVDVPRLYIAPFEQSAAIKLLMALAVAGREQD